MAVWMKMTLRLPLQVHTALTAKARADNVSLNQLIVDRLNASLGGVYVSEEDANDANLIQRLDALESDVAAIKKKLGMGSTG